MNPSYLYFEVEDTGIGIPKAKIPSLFQKFSKIEESEHLNPNGVGLGLFICKKVVESCGGEIKVDKSVLKSENPLNHGTTFIFTMPFS
jgi:signal transduction histidine kinase